ncbi:MAG: TIM barrel protein [Armatimonadetes bacterium]|nr:TIM barrel protein [Armatimonadota bacterium]NIO74573.1 TIM barrel protein [Armatimonadota bacterium]NIO97498.1 TIM barrel protein [Armatimonadota bacterium]
MKVSIVVSTQPAQFEAATFKGDLAANLERISGLGYDGVELAIRDPRLVNTDDLTAMLERRGLEAPAIGTGQAWGEESLSFTDANPDIRRTAIERIKSHLPLANRLGAIVILGLIRGTLRPGVEHDQAMALLVEALRECSAAASEAGVRLALEPINRYETTLINTVAEGLELIERVGADNFGLLLDTFHMNIEEPSIEESMRKAKERIFHFHVADSNRRYPGAGHTDFPAILGLLKESGYSGYVSGEFLPLPDAATAAKKAISYLRAI